MTQLLYPGLLRNNEDLHFRLKVSHDPAGLTAFCCDNEDLHFRLKVSHDPASLPRSAGQ
jgi:hypothetical protein